MNHLKGFYFYFMVMLKMKYDNQSDGAVPQQFKLIHVHQKFNL